MRPGCPELRALSRRGGCRSVLSFGIPHEAMKTLSDECIYTIVHRDSLAVAARKGGPASFPEHRAWTTGHRLWQEAKDKGTAMPILLGDAADCSRLLYWGLLIDVETGHGWTSYTVDCIRPLRGRHTPQELVLRSTGQHIAPYFIRPYAICRTPKFLRDQSRTTRSTEPPPAASASHARSRSDARYAAGGRSRRRSVS